MYNYLLITFIILFIDLIWLYINANKYNNLIEKIQKTSLSINFIGAFFSYFTIIVGLFLFSIPMIEYKLKEKKYNLLLLSIIYGGGLGFILYGMFNATNYGIFKNYDYKVALLDTFWGFSLLSFISYIFFLL